MFMQGKKFDFKFKYLIVSAIMIGGLVAFSGCTPIAPLDESAPAEESQTSAQSDAKTDAQAETTTAEVSSDTPKTGYTPGSIAIDFSLQALDGTTYKLSDYKGKTVVVNFFASWCPPCQAETPHFVETYANYKDKDVVFLGVNLIDSDTENDLVKFIEDMKIDYPVVLDTGSAVADKYRIRSIPVTMVVKPDGVISQYQIGAVNSDTLVEWIEEAKAAE